MDYSDTERECRGCMGPCGRCHEAAGYVVTSADRLAWMVVRRGARGNPAAVTACDGALRGSYLEAHLNFRLALFELRLQVWLSLPAVLRRWVPAPRPFWWAL
jgi:hypothetical protein